MQYTIFNTPVLSVFLRGLAWGLVKAFRWRLEGDAPDLRKYVLIAAPHTSNMDLPVMLVLAFRYRTQVSWMGKDSLFRPPFGRVSRWLGGIPIDRSKKNNVVEQSVELFRSREALVLAVPPEGTRKQVRYWKTGFYYIARGAGVPILLGFIDYGRKVGGFGPVLVPSGNIEEDMKTIRSFYAGITGRHPDQSNRAAVRPGG